MSSFEDQMERRNSSTYSLSSIGGSEVGSGYLMESGFYITSFVATIFGAALVAIAVLFITLLITLTITLQSCQNQSAAVIRQENATESYAYCKVFTLHAELNKLEPNEFPSVCYVHVINYITEGRHLSDLKFTVSMARKYFSTSAPTDSFDIVLIDIDHIFHTNNLLDTMTSLPLFRLDSHDRSHSVEEVKHSIRTLLHELSTTLRASGWSLVYITMKPEKQRNATEETLVSAGFGGWSSLIMRSEEEEMRMESWEYFSKKRIALCNQGFRIKAVISSTMDALTGPCLGNRSFKLPNPIYGLGQDVKETSNS